MNKVFIGLKKLQVRIAMISKRNIELNYLKIGRIVMEGINLLSSSYSLGNP